MIDILTNLRERGDDLSLAAATEIEAFRPTVANRHDPRRLLPPECLQSVIACVKNVSDITVTEDEVIMLFEGDREALMKVFAKWPHNESGYRKAIEDMLRAYLNKILNQPSAGTSSAPSVPVPPVNTNVSPSPSACDLQSDDGDDESRARRLLQADEISYVRSMIENRAGVVLTDDETALLLAANRDVVGQIVRWGTCDTGVDDAIMDMIAKHLRGIRWPLNGDSIDFGLFTFSLKVAAVGRGYKVTESR